MNAERFDTWSRARVQGITRRRLLRTVSAGSAGVALSRLTGASAQFGGATTCQYTMQMTTSHGPSTGTTYSGTLSLDIDDDGAIETGTFTPALATSQPVVGQANGHGLDLLISLPDGGVLSLTGSGTQPIDTCDAAIQGYFGGPAATDLGTWEAEPGESGASGSGSQGAQLGGQPSQPVCPPAECGLAFVQDPVTCQCVCAPGLPPCGGNCCPAGSSCSEGICMCPGDAIQCGTSCVGPCGANQFVDYDTCLCTDEEVPACTQSGGACQQGFQCCTGYCQNGICASCNISIWAQVCDEQCVDLHTNPYYCGSCLNNCLMQQKQACQNGVCV
jgi:hypothetical protein